MDNLYPATTLSIMPTWQCNASCSDCGTYSHPKNKVSLNAEMIMSAIDQAKQDKIEIVVFTGGEATLKLPDLLKYIRHATDIGLATRLVTNCWWASTDYLAEKTLSALKTAGLKEINFSTGDEHAKFISVSSVAKAIIKSVQHDFHPYVMVELRENALVTKDSVIGVLSENGFLVDDTIVSFIESPWTPVDPMMIGKYNNNICANKSNLSQRVGCDSLFNTPTLQANGVVGVCCGIGMQRLQTLQVGEFSSNGLGFNSLCASSEQDIVKMLVKHFGPEKTIAMASEFNDAIVWEDMYAHKCQACIRLLSDDGILHEITSRESYFLMQLAASIAAEKVLTQLIDSQVECAELK